jgi:hypothetical protein
MRVNGTGGNRRNFWTGISAATGARGANILPPIAGDWAWCMSKYYLDDTDELWIITNDDHSTTVMMVPGEIDNECNFKGEAGLLEEYESELQSR